MLCLGPGHCRMAGGKQQHRQVCPTAGRCGTTKLSKTKDLIKADPHDTMNGFMKAVLCPWAATK